MSTHAKSIKDGYTGTKYTVTKCPPPVGDETGRAPWKTGQNHVRGTHSYTESYTGKKRGNGKKSARRPSGTVLGARHGKLGARHRKLGKTMYEAPPRTRTSTRAKNVDDGSV